MVSNKKIYTFDKYKAIETALTQWDEEQETFVTRAPGFDFLLGAGDTEHESMADFLADLDIHHRAWLNGTHAILNHRGLGRPFSGRVSVNTRMKPAIKVALENLAKFHKKTKGEIIEILVEKAQHNEMIL